MCTCGCACLYVCVYAYVSVYVCTQTRVCMYICLCAHVDVHVLYIYVCVCVFEVVPEGLLLRCSYKEILPSPDWISPRRTGSPGGAVVKEPSDPDRSEGLTPCSSSDPELSSVGFPPLTLFFHFL